MSAHLQDFVLNSEFCRSRPTTQQILCELEFLIPQFADHVGQHGYHGEGPQLAAQCRAKTPTVESLYAEEDSPEEQTYSQAWDSYLHGVEEVVEEEPPIRRRVGAKAKASDSVGAQGAASSAPGRSSSVGSWVGKDFLQDHPSDPSPAGPKKADGPRPWWKPLQRTNNSLPQGQT